MKDFSPGALAAVIGTLPGEGRLRVAFSGGLDSTVLLYALARLAPQRGLAAVHVHHGIDPAADAWARHCAGVCAHLCVPLEVVRVEVAGRPGGPEAAARAARYEALAARTGPGEVLLTAHHGDDQLETVLLQLVRGAGVRGLAAMPPLRPFGRGWHARPLLAWDRAALAAWARAQGLSWVEDRANRDPRYDRAFLRHEVVPLLRRRWPHVAAAAVRSAARCAEALAMLDTLADIDGAEPPRPLPLGRVRAQAPARARNLVRAWIAGHGLRPPSDRWLEEVLAGFLAAGADRRPRALWRGGELRCWRGALYTGPRLPPPPQGALPWRGRGALALPAGCGEVAWTEGAPGIDPGLVEAGGMVGWRRGGERLRPAGGAMHRPLKHLMQERGVPPWVRERMPLFLQGARLLAAGPWWIEATAARPEGLVPVWCSPLLEAWSGGAALLGHGGSGTL